MRAIVVYESMFGSTAAIAKAIAAGLSTEVHTDLYEVSDAPAELGADVGLLVAGGPTHAFGMTRPGTRRSAAQQATGPLVSRGIGIREWLEKLGTGGHEVEAVTFDTKVQRPPLPGSASHAAARKLRHRGLRMIGHGESFWVTGTQGPLHEGEVERARRWGAELASRLAARQPAR